MQKTKFTLFIRGHRYRIYEGKRGGKFIIVNDRRRYLKHGPRCPGS